MSECVCKKGRGIGERGEYNKALADSVRLARNQQLPAAASCVLIIMVQRDGADSDCAANAECG